MTEKSKAARQSTLRYVLLANGKGAPRVCNFSRWPPGGEDGPKTALHTMLLGQWTTCALSGRHRKP
eukprot:scaffold158038_cov30-Tisochrysis_lutea.AAC.2